MSIWERRPSVYMVRVQRHGERAATTVHGTKRDARRVEQELVADLEAGLSPRRAKLTLTEYLRSQWLPHIEANREPRTFERYLSAVRTHLVPAIGRVRLDHITPARTQRLLDELSAKGLAPKSVHTIRGVLAKALNDAVRWQILPRNPVTPTTTPVVAKRPYRVLSRAEGQLMLEAAVGLPIEPILHVALMCGSRQGEVIGLKWDAVDLDAGVIRIVGALKPVLGQGLIYGSTKEDREHSVDLTPSVVIVLRDHRIAQMEHRLRVGEAYLDRGFVFTHEDGRPIHPQTLRKWWRKLLAAAEIERPWPTWHDLRHTQATMMLQMGVHPQIVAERLGHATPDVTTRIYSHVVPGLQRRAAHALDAWFYGESGTDVAPERRVSASQQVQRVVGAARFELATS